MLAHPFLLMFDTPMSRSVNPLTTGPDCIPFHMFLLAHYMSAFKYAKDKTWLQSKRFEKRLTLILSILKNFHSLEVVDRVSETQLQVGENSNWIIWRLQSYNNRLPADKHTHNGG